MDLTLGKRADYTVRAVLDLARHHDAGRRRAKDIAATMAVPATYLPALLAELVRAGIVRSTAGPAGGYELARSPADVSLLEVLEVADGELRSTECVLRGGPCHWEGRCAVHGPWAAAQEAMRASLAATTFADIARLDVLLEGAGRP
jgi:Rrf2 family protein